MNDRAPSPPFRARGADGAAPSNKILSLKDTRSKIARIIMFNGVSPQPVPRTPPVKSRTAENS